MGTKPSLLQPRFRVLAYADQNFISTVADDQGQRDRLIALRDNGEVGIVISPWHLYEIGRGTTDRVDRIITYLEVLNPLWIFPRMDLLTWEFATAWDRFWNPKKAFQPVGSLDETTTDMRPLIPVADDIRTAVTSFQAEAARRYMRDTLDPHRLISEKNRESFKHGQFDKGLRRRVDLEVAGLHLARMSGVPLGHPQLQDVARAILAESLTRAKIEFFLEFGGNNDLKAAEVEWQLTLSFYRTSAQLNPSRFVDRQHAVVALPYCALFLTDDADLRKRCAEVRQSLWFPCAEVLSEAEFFTRFRGVFSRHSLSPTR
jgi:hypothetical protein